MIPETEKHAYLRKETRALVDMKPHPQNPRVHPAPGSAEWKTLEASLEHDYFDPIVFNERNGMLVSGRMRTKVLLHLGYVTADVVVVDYDEKTHLARLVAANAHSGKDDKDKLGELFASLRESDVDPVLAMLKALPDPPKDKKVELAAPDETAGEKFAAKWGVKYGQVWQLGAHRIACGECRDSALLAVLMGEERASCLHADPPYGMGKEALGVVNDNLYGEKLDAFQMQWWHSCRPFVADNGSAYIWGQAAELWRLWYRGGLADAEVLELRNELVWDKGSTPGQTSDLMTQFPVASERALFMQFGRQFIENMNADQYWDGWDALLLPLIEMAESAGLTSKRCHEITGTSMFPRWFTRSQWQFIGAKHYAKLAAEFPTCFNVPYAELRARYEEIKGAFRSYQDGILGGMRSYFDNTHAIMNDSWRFPRVVGEERFGHATPKPVDMMKRILQTGVPPGGIVLCPFGGTGPELIAAEQTDRRYRGVEIQPSYVAVIIERWHRLTGELPEKIHGSND